MGKYNFYAVRVGWRTGIFRSSEDARDAADGFSGAEMCGFWCQQDAEDYLNPSDDDTRCYSNKTYRSEWKGALLECDGAAKGNPGPASCGGILTLLDGSGRKVKQLERYSSYLGERTNNVAEYFSVIQGMQEAIYYGITELIIRMDSQLVVNQMDGTWKIRSPSLRLFAYRAREMAEQFPHGCTVKWVDRSRNTQADKLANQAIWYARENVIALAATKAQAGFEPLFALQAVDRTVRVHDADVSNVMDSLIVHFPGRLDNPGVRYIDRNLIVYNSEDDLIAAF